MVLVFDTNVLVSSFLLRDSIPFRARVSALRHHQMLYSAETLRELSAVLTRPKFRKYLSLQDAQLFVERIREAGMPVVISELVFACSDPDDDKFLELAVNGTASHIVTGDRALLELHPFRGTAIVTPAQWLEMAGDTP